MASEPGQLAPRPPHPVLAEHDGAAEARRAHVNELFDRFDELSERIVRLTSLGAGGVSTIEGRSAAISSPDGEGAVVLGAMRDAGLVDESVRTMGPLHDDVARRPEE